MDSDGEIGRQSGPKMARRGSPYLHGKLGQANVPTVIHGTLKARCLCEQSIRAEKRTCNKTSQDQEAIPHAPLDRTSAQRRPSTNQIVCNSLVSGPQRRSRKQCGSLPEFLLLIPVPRFMPNLVECQWRIALLRNLAPRDQHRKA